MAEAASFHRDAARILRKQSAQELLRNRYSKARFFKSQAEWHEIEANRLDDTEGIQIQLQETALLFVREAVLQGWTCGWVKWHNNDYKATVYVEHRFLGLLGWDMPIEKIPAWLGPFPNDAIDWNREEMYSNIDRYLRGIRSE